MNKKGFLILMLIIFVHAAIVFAIVSQTDAYRFRHLKKYLNDNCSIHVAEIHEFESDDENEEEFQGLKIRVDSHEDSLSLEYIASIYNALNEYAKLDSDKYFKSNLKINVLIEREWGLHYCYSAAVNYRGNGDSYLLRDSFVSISIRCNSTDLEYIDLFEGCEVLFIQMRNDPIYHHRMGCVGKELAEELKNIESLDKIYVTEEWYDIFCDVLTDMDVRIYE